MPYKCPWLHCLAGLGLAGMETCFLRGDLSNPSCSNFIEEHSWYIMKKSEHLQKLFTESMESYLGEC